MNEAPLDAAGILAILDRFEIRFVLIGGLAARLHGSPSITDDVDICYSREEKNLKRLTAALRSIHARLRGVSEDVPFILDERSLKVGDSFTFLTDFGSLDILGTPSGTDGYESLEANASQMDVGGFKIPVASLDDLIAMKRAAGRPKDRVELEILGALRDVLEGRD